MRFTITTLAILAALPLFASRQAPAQEEAAPEIVARIGEDAVVTRREFDRTLQQMTRSGEEMSHEQQLELLNNIVDVKLQHVLAKKEGVEVTEAEIDADIAQRTQGMPAEQFIQRLESVGITEEEFRSLVSEQMAVAEFRQTLKDDVKAVTEDDVVAEYEELNEDGQFDRVDVSHILIRVDNPNDEAAWTEAKTRIDAARERVTEGEEDFNAVAKEVSEDPGVVQNGGSYPDTPRGQMVPEFEERMFALDVGAISEPFRTQFGWHILTPTARRSIPLDDVADDIRVFITEQRINDHVMDLVAEAKANTDIEIRLEPGDGAAS
jgi:parvulin-like peptidyl-prolyl isomerase